MVIRNVGHLKTSLQTFVDSLMASAFVNLPEGAELSTNCVCSHRFCTKLLSESFHNFFTRMVHIPWCLKQNLHLKC